MLKYLKNYLRKELNEYGYEVKKISMREKKTIFIKVVN